ncbi:hypothetical protein ACQB60_44085 [Actinomycetota bacterium Odt1-20B]
MSKFMTVAALVASATTVSAPAALALSPHDTTAASPTARVVASQIVDRSGGTLSGAVNGGTAQLIVPEGAFKKPTVLRMTTADTTAIDGGLGQVGYSGYRTLAAVGVKAYKVDGSTTKGKFARPLSLTVKGSGLHEGQKAVQLNLTHPEEQKASFSPGKAELRVNGTPDLIFVAPKSSAARAGAAADSKSGAAARSNSAAGTEIAGATKAQTGVPLTPELVGAGLALAAGTTLLLGAASGLRRTRNVA